MGKDPLLFIKTPPAFFRETVPVETGAELIESIVIEDQTEHFESAQKPSAHNLDNSELVKRKERLHFLSKPFQQRAYQPLVFVLHDGQEITGVVKKFDSETEDVFIRTSETVLTYKVWEISDLVWRGSSFFKPQIQHAEKDKIDAES